MKRSRLLWITDPWSTLDVARDTTVRLVQASEKLGIESFIAEYSSLEWDSKNPPTVQLKDSKGANRGEQAIAVFSQIHYRVDPPIDARYLAPLAILQAAGLSARVVNPIAAIALQSEKLITARAKDLAPPFVLSANRNALEAWGEKQGRTVLKPLHDAQSRGVELLEWAIPSHRKKALALLERATLQYKQPVLLQRYLPEIEKGELRTWWVDGQMIGSLTKLPLAGDFRVQIDAGSRVTSGKPSRAVLAKFPAVRKLLRAHGIRLAAIDWIGDVVSDFNITSPGLLRQLEEVTGQDLASDVIRALVRKRR